MHFGATLRLLRIDAGVGLRELARQVGVSGAYLSRVENGHDPIPTPERLVSIADALGVPRAVLLELGRETGAAMSEYLARVPGAGELMFEIARRNLGSAQVARLLAVLDREFPLTASAPRREHLSELLGHGEMVLSISCSDIEDLVHIAATRLPLPTQLDRRELALRLLARERESASAIGSGFLVPHCMLPGADSGAVVLTLNRPLRIATPDEKPVTVAVALIAGDSAAQVAGLAQVARVASGDLAAKLRVARTPRDALDVIRKAETSPRA
jgi:PTS system nitrogen regulatory IIA component